MGRLRNITDSRVGKAGSTVRGATIYSPFGKKIGGNVGQRIDESGTTQYYDLGTRYVSGDGRVYRYAKAGGTLIPGQGVHNYEEEYIRYAVLPAAVAAGSNTISATVNAHDGSRDTHNGSIAANELVGGYIVVFDKSAVNHVVLRMITSNTVVASGGGTTVMTVDDIFPLALTTSDAIAAMCSPYLNVQSHTDETMPFVGVPTVPATVGQYVWIQTWGVCWIASQAAVGTGANVHDVVFRHDGSLDIHTVNETLQHAGFTISSRARAGAQGETFIMLQISI